MKKNVLEKEVQGVVQRYPQRAQEKFRQIHQLMLDSAKHSDLGVVEASIKWGEPSFVTKHGSPVRIAWKESTPEQIGVFFICTTRLVDTFRELYDDTLNLHENRAIHLQLNDSLPEPELKHCLQMAFNYHKVKNLPLLGA